MITDQEELILKESYASDYIEYPETYIVAYVGPAGGGKSLSMTQEIVWFLCEDRTIWSNMKVRTSPAIINTKTYIDGTPIKYKETEPLDWGVLLMLDESIMSGIVAIDEIGYFDDSRAFNSTRNKLINACVRQARHRDLSLLYTVNNIMRVDNRLREETDIIVECEDLHYTPWGKEHNIRKGIAIQQRYYGGMTGRVRGSNYFDFKNRQPYEVRRLIAARYRSCYDTREIVSLEEMLTPVKVDLKARYITNKEASNDNYDINIAIQRKVEDLEISGVEAISYRDFASIVQELGLPNNKTTRARFRSSGLVFNPERQLYEVERVVVGVSR